jgi:small-conductance mechanosensitive channel
VPLNYFFEKPFQNWTRSSSSILGSAIFHLDYTADIDRVRRRFDDIVKSSPLWDGNVANLQVVGITEHGVEIRALASARDSSLSWDLRCELREKILDFLRRDYPEALPHLRADLWEQTPRREQKGLNAESNRAEKTAEP